MPRKGDRRGEVARFWSKVDKTGKGDCWVWTGGGNAAGYGRMERDNRRKVLAHRFSYEIHNGPIPGGMCVLHRCDSPPCVNPDHLFLGTNIENIRDMMSKSRQPLGEQKWNARLSSDDVVEARGMYAAGVPIAEIARVYGLSWQGMRDVVRRLTWRHVS